MPDAPPHVGHSLDEVLAATDLATWCALAEDQRLLRLGVIARELGPDFHAAHIPREPRDVRFRTSGARLVHRPTQLVFCFVPGGTFQMGLGEVEAAHLEASLDDNDLEWLSEALPRMRPTRVVSVGAFLLGETPLGSDVKPLRLEPSDVASWLGQPGGTPSLRLPSEAEWEYAYRAGTRTPFFWGPWLPIAPPALPHPLGLAMMGFWREAMADAWREDLGEHASDGAPAGPSDARLRATRGGGAERWPWAPMSGGWRPLLSAWRGEPRDVLSHDPRLRRTALRPALGLRPAAAPEPLPDDLPSWTLAPETSRALMRLVSPSADERAAGASELVRATRGRLGPVSGQGALAVPYLLDLAQETFVPDRVALLELATTLLSAGDVRLHAAARAMHAAGRARLARLDPLARDPEPALATAARALLQRLGMGPL